MGSMSFLESFSEDTQDQLKKSMLKCSLLFSANRSMGISQQRKEFFLKTVFSIIVSEETGRISIAIASELNYNLTLEDARIMLLDALQPKKETFYEADVESESEENEKDI